MSSALSNQSFVRDGAGYKELYSSGYKDPDELSERTPSATSPSSTNEDMELAEPEEGSDGDGEGPKSVVGADGLREFVMLPEWTVNKFWSTIKEVHFNIPSVFILVIVEALNFLHPSLPVFHFRPSVLGFVTPL